jgi:hypothetical protein
MITAAAAALVVVVVVVVLSINIYRNFKKQIKL